MVIHPTSRPLSLMLFTLRGSIVPAIWKRVVGMMLLAVLMVGLERRLPHAGVDLGAVPLTLMGLTLAIFLGFRNNVAYERWWEARTLWGELLIVLRNLARQTCSLPDDLPREQQRLRVHRLIAFAHALRHQLRGTPAAEDLSRWLPAAEAAALAHSPNPPNALLGSIGESYAQLRREHRLDSILLAGIDAQVSRMSYVLGGCERIHGTPIPFAYILLLHRTVYMYCLLLPFCLVSSVGWLTPLMVGVLSYTFFGLDALGDQIENPFERLPNDLALDAMCRTIEISLGELLGEQELPAPLQPVDGVLL
ncbi:bestrophin family protein [Dyella soli]|uniref:Bestrophin n=1 Tax=Dyella soli TaxID=522319 RepID=A0A4R0YR21_9GAMM|nr:bestrophin family ion channel [Dyella soli]TCI09020.1 bestrophin [Dyella soli]